MNSPLLNELIPPVTPGKGMKNVINYPTLFSDCKEIAFYPERRLPVSSCPAGIHYVDF
jgi:hypothetical protein